ncbi:hypothetical protein [Actinomadura sp. K4S16]|uniref:hypothetical protein n=1 Tax=Actinomadura sp. K4S16 TaxID=1316147 RepID=UPI0011EDAF4E|nr:hypothetical protein [Actinomadura sp. K4S16]
MTTATASAIASATASPRDQTWAEVARFGRAATRGGGTAEDAAVVVAIAALVLAVLAAVALIRAWHDHQQHRRQAAALHTGSRRCQIAARAHAGNVSPPWHRRPYGDVGDAALRRQADHAAAEYARFTALEERTAALLQEAHAGDGPAVRQLRARAAAAAAETELPAARERLAAALADQDAARERLAELAPLADRGRLALCARNQPSPTDREDVGERLPAGV